MMSEYKEEYYIKIGKMYVFEMKTSEDSINTNFLRSIDFTDSIDEAYKINENEIENIKEILAKVFEFDNKEQIQFELMDR